MKINQVSCNWQSAYICMSLAILFETGYHGPLWRSEYNIPDEHGGGTFITFYVEESSEFVDGLEGKSLYLIDKIPEIDYNVLHISFEQHPNYKDTQNETV